MYQLSYEGRACCMSNKNMQLANTQDDHYATLQVGKLRKDLGSGVGPLRIYDYTVMMAGETRGTCLRGMSCESSKSGLGPRPYVVSWLGSPGNW